MRVEGGCVRWTATSDPLHRYYRVYKDGKQIASTVTTGLPVPGMKPEDAKRFAVKSVDMWGNVR